MTISAQAPKMIARTRSFTCFKKGFITFALFCGVSQLSLAQSTSVELIGINMSGAGFASHVLPGMNNRNYIFPTESHFKYWKAQGINTIRFPVIWERLQPTLNSNLEPGYTKLIDEVFALGNKYNIKIILDLHNYARYRGKIIGTETVPYSAYYDVMRKIALKWSNQKSLEGYDIMNEPHDALAYWPTAAQHAINAVRTVDHVRPIYVEGSGWSGTSRWHYYNDPLLKLKDPANNIIFEGHVYFDENSGGNYGAVNMESFDTDIGVRKVQPFIDWLRKNNRKGIIGEFGVPDTHPKYLEAMDNMLKHLKTYCIPAYYWAAGPGWANYSLAIEPVNNQPRPQWEVIKKYRDNTSCSSIGPHS